MSGSQATKTMMGEQTSYLKALCQQADVQFEPGHTTSQTFKRLEVLQSKTDRRRDP